MTELNVRNLLQGEVCRVHRDEAWVKEDEIKAVTGGKNYYPHDQIKKVYIFVDGGNMLVLSTEGEYFSAHLKPSYFVTGNASTKVIN